MPYPSLGPISNNNALMLAGQLLGYCTMLPCLELLFLLSCVSLYSLMATLMKYLSGNAGPKVMLCHIYDLPCLLVKGIAAVVSDVTSRQTIFHF